MFDEEIDKFDANIQYFTEEVQYFTEQIQDLINKIKQTQFEQYNYLKNRKLFNEINKLQKFKLLQESKLLQ